MENIRKWKTSRLLRNKEYLMIAALLLVTCAISIKQPSSSALFIFSWLVVTLLILYGKLLYIKTSGNGIEVCDIFRYRRIGWAEITGYANENSMMIIYFSTRKSLTVYPDKLKDQGDFTALVNTKLEQLLRFRCSPCGGLLVSDKLKCPNCGRNLH
jgi:hypothetical protein